MYNDRRITAALMIEDMLSAKLDRNNVYQTLRKAGFDVLGAGCYGTAVKSKCGTFVVKVCWDERDGYPLYAQFCKDNPQPHLPDIFHIAEIDGLCFVAMPVYEDLDALPGREDVYMYERDEAGYDPSTSFRRAVKMVRDMFRDVACLDMHMGNFMWDAERDQCIITDPIAGIVYPGRAEASAAVSGRPFKAEIHQQLELDVTVQSEASPEFKLVCASFSAFCQGINHLHADNVIPERFFL